MMSLKINFLIKVDIVCVGCVVCKIFILKLYWIFVIIFKIGNIIKLYFFLFLYICKSDIKYLIDGDFFIFLWFYLFLLVC